MQAIIIYTLLVRNTKLPVPRR